jgi:hypothetical protein
MSQERLNDLVVLSIEKNMLKNIDLEILLMILHLEILVGIFFMTIHISMCFYFICDGQELDNVLCYYFSCFFLASCVFYSSSLLVLLCCCFVAYVLSMDVVDAVIVKLLLSYTVRNYNVL